jgi:Protein kinase domain
VTEQPIAPALPAPRKVRAPSPRNGHEAGAATALEPSEPTRSAWGRLRRAAAARAAIVHPNLLRAWPVGEGEGRLFVAFERCPHPSLAELLAAAPLEPTVCARILDGAAAGVGALSQSALVARDLTPKRVLVDPKHGCRLMDLGIPPELLRRVPLELDPDGAFRSPEQLERKPVDLRSSVYSLGAILFTALTGLPPGSPSDRRSELSPEINSVVSRALAQHPADRYPDPEALSRAVAAAVGADLGRKGVTSSRNGHRQQRLPKPAAPAPQRKRDRRTIALQENGRATPPRERVHPRVGPAETPPSSRRAASAAAAATRRGAKVVWTLFLRVCCLVLVAARRAAAVVVVAAGRARRAVIRLKRSAPSLARDQSGRIDRVTRDCWTVGSRHMPGRGRPSAAIGTTAQRASTHRRLLLPAVGAIVASALSGIALGRAFEPEEGPSSVSRSGLAVQLPPGWEPAGTDHVLPTLSPTIAAAPSGEAGAGLVAGKLSSLAAAERMLARMQRESDGRTQVGLGRLNAWQYAGLRPRPHVVGTGYLIPTTGGAVLAICHASANAARFPLAQCKGAATTLVIGGDQPRPLASADRSNERTIRVIATLRASRSRGRRRLEAAELGRGQARAATALQLSHNRAARALDRISTLESGHSLRQVSAATRNTAAAYGRLAHAALVSNLSAYREARHAVVREEEVLRRELARTGDA